MRIQTAGWTLAVALTLAFAGCGGEAPGTPKPGHGVIRGIDATRSEVTIEHGDIPGLMKAMTMPFSVDDPAILAGVSVGDEVDFEAKLDGERYVVVAIERALE